MWSSDIGSSTSSTPATAASTSRVRSSCVGPRPPVARTRSARSQAARKHVDVVVEVVGDGGVEADGDADLGEPAAEPLAVGVEVLAAGEFAADGEDFGFHVVTARGTEEKQNGRARARAGQEQGRGTGRGRARARAGARARRRSYVPVPLPEFSSPDPQIIWRWQSCGAPLFSHIRSLSPAAL